MKVLSLFNGMNCIGLALKNLDIKFELYASEIDKYATKVSDKLFPNTINLGDVTKIDLEKLPVFDLVVGGSPCQGFSFAGKQLNFEDERSKLFFDFVKIVEYCKKKNPKLKFLLENVKMKQQHEAVISRFMGIDPIEINSSLLSAQNRRRLYWTNIGTTKANLFGIEEPGIKQPKDKGILLKDILEAEVDEKYNININSNSVKNNFNIVEKSIKNKKSTCIDASYYKGFGIVFNDCRQVVKCDRKGNVKNNQNKSSSLSVGGNGCGNHSDMDILIIPKLINKNSVVQLNSSKESGKKQPYQHNRVYHTEAKSPCLDCDSSRKSVLIIPEATKKGFTEIKEGNCFDATFLNSNTIRRLTPKECARLQTIPNWAIKKMLNCGVSDSQLYKMLGNGWTVEVIAYILSHLENLKKCQK